MSKGAFELLEPEVGIMVETFFDGASAGGVFRRFLQEYGERIAACRAEADNGGFTIYLEVKTQGGFFRQVRLRREGQGESAIICSETVLAYDGSAIVTQIVLAFASDSRFSRYRLRVCDEQRMELFCEVRASSLADTPDCYDLIVHLADTAAKIEA